MVKNFRYSKNNFEIKKFQKRKFYSKIDTWRNYDIYYAYEIQKNERAQNRGD
jgi:hypothetical protein